MWGGMTTKAIRLGTSGYSAKKRTKSLKEEEEGQEQEEQAGKSMKS